HAVPVQRGFGVVPGELHRRRQLHRRRLLLGWLMRGEEGQRQRLRGRQRVHLHQLRRRVLLQQLRRAPRRRVLGGAGRHRQRHLHGDRRRLGGLAFVHAVRLQRLGGFVSFELHGGRQLHLRRLLLGGRLRGEKGQRQRLRGRKRVHLHQLRRRVLLQ